MIGDKTRRGSDMKIEGSENEDVSLQLKDLLGSWGNTSYPEGQVKDSTTPKTPNTNQKNEAQNALTQILLENN